MADKDEKTSPGAEVEEDSETPGYKPPAPKTLSEIQSIDTEDESLEKYKKALLGDVVASGDASDSRRIIVEKMTMMVEGRPDRELDLTGDISSFKKLPLIIKEGIEFRIKITFKVRGEIVTGLKYVQVTTRKGIKVDTSKYMVGSYGPKVESQSYTTPVEEAASGMLARGHYNVKSKFTDDDKNEHLNWEWAFEIKKEWK